MDNNATDTAGCFSNFGGFPGGYLSHWWIYLCVSAVIYGLGFVLTAFATLAWKVLTYYYVVSEVKERALSEFLVNYIGERSRFSVILEFLALIIDVLYLCLYVVRTYYGLVTPVQSNQAVLVMVIIEACLVFLLMVPFFVRFIQSRRLLFAWFSLYMIVDVLTLPHPFVSLVFSCDWVGLRHLRFLSLRAVSKILVQVRVITSPLLADAASLIVTFVAIWLTSAGMVYLLEVSGDPWDNFSNAQDAYYLEYVYFAMATMTTVGYGDISPRTALGRVFVTFFMIAGLALFALALGPITDYLAADKKYYTYYSIDPSRPHIVVCGDIDHNRIKNVLVDFLHPDRVSVLNRPDIVFLMKDYPSSDLKHVLQKHFPHAFYLIGSMFKLQDLQRVQLSHAAACIIMTDTSLQYQDASDGTAIMRYIAVKNYSNHIRVIMQVAMGATQRKLEALPVWNPEKDLVFCVNQWRLGWLSAACYSPGLSTVLGNLICPVALPKKLFFHKEPTLYKQGASLEIYCTQLPEFLTLREAWKVTLDCRSACDLTLIAVEVDGELNISPATDEHYIIPQNSLGYFIAENEGDLRALQYLRALPTVERSNFVTVSLTPMPDLGLELCENESNEIPAAPSQTLRLAANKIVPSELDDHYVLCIFAHKHSPLVELTAFCQPLLQRPQDTLVIITCQEYADKLASTRALKDFSNAHILPGSPLDLDCLRKAGVSKCKYCALMTVSLDKGIEELALVDKEAILCLRLLEGMSHKNGGKVPFVVELLEEDNVQFVYLDDDDEGVEQVQLSTPYAWGSVVTMGMVDLLMATSFYNAQSTKIVQKLVTNPSVATVAIGELPTHISSFFEAFEFILKKGKLCIGVMRMANKTVPTSYYPITTPHSTLTLEPEDLLLVLL